MKILNISGNSFEHILSTAKNLQLAGFQPAKPSSKNPGIDLDAWAEGVVGNQPDHRSSILEVGALWNQVAIDIFLENHGKKSWFWAEKKLPFFHDYWADFDPNILFLFVYTSPHDALVSQFRNGIHSHKRLLECINEWIEITEVFLRFYSENSKRCLIVHHANLVDDHSYLIDHLERKFLSDLVVTERWVWDSVEDASLDYLISDVLLYTSRLRKLEDRARKIILAPPTEDIEIPERISLEKALESYGQICDKASKKQNLNSPSDPLFNDIAQRELIEEFESENEHLLIELHSAQEALEDLLKESRAQDLEKKILEERLNKALLENIGYLECDSFNVKSNKRGLEWSFYNITLDKINFSELCFETYQKGAAFYICFQKQCGGRDIFTRWPLALRDKSEVEISSTESSSNKSGSSTINILATTDWEFIRYLISRLGDFVIGKPHILKENKKARDSLIDGCQRLKATIEKAPLVMRYDKAEIVERIEINDYRALGFSMTNISVGDNRKSNLDFRIAAFESSDNKFGAYPRIEFLESSKEFFENWFIEKDDERGGRLEFRFSHPSDLDVDVWNKFSSNDKVMVSAVIASIPNLLQNNSLTNADGLVIFERWGAVGDFMIKTLSEFVRSMA